MNTYPKTATTHENSTTNLYVYEYKGRLSDKITYRKNLVSEIQGRCGNALGAFDADAMNEASFRSFAERAKAEGFTIYRLVQV